MRYELLLKSVRRFSGRLWFGRRLVLHSCLLLAFPGPLTGCQATLALGPLSDTGQAVNGSLRRLEAPRIEIVENAQLLLDWQVMQYLLATGSPSVIYPPLRPLK